MTKIVDEPKVIGHKEINGEQNTYIQLQNRNCSYSQKKLAQLMKAKKRLLTISMILTQILKRKIFKEMSQFLHLD